MEEKRRISIQDLKNKTDTVREFYRKHKKIIKGVALATLVAVGMHTGYREYQKSHEPTPEIEIAPLTYANVLDDIARVRPAAITYLGRALRTQGSTGHVDDKELLDTFFNGLEMAYETGTGKEIYGNIFRGMMEQYMKITIANAYNETEHFKLSPEDIHWNYVNDERSHKKYEVWGTTNNRTIKIADSRDNSYLPTEFEQMLGSLDELSKKDDAKTLQDALEKMKNLCGERYIGVSNNGLFSRDDFGTYDGKVKRNFSYDWYLQFVKDHEEFFKYTEKVTPENTDIPGNIQEEEVER